MKKSLLALAVGAAIVASGSAQALTVYDKDGTTMGIGGRIQGVYYGKDAGDASQPETGDASLNGSGRLSFDLRTQLFSGVDGIAFSEWDVSDGEDNDSFSPRYIWAGLDFGNLGTAKFGKVNDAYYYVQETADIYDDFGIVDNTGYNDRRSGNMVYSWSGYGATVNLSYSTSKQDQNVKGSYLRRYYSDGSGSYGSSQKLDIEQGGAISVGYASPDILFGPIDFRIGYGYMAFSNHSDDNGEYYNSARYRVFNDDGSDAGYYNYDVRYDDMNQYGASLTWGNKKSGPYINLIYQIRSFSFIGIPSSVYAEDLDVTSYGINLGYHFANGFGLIVGGQAQNVEYDEIDVDAWTVPVYATYDVSKNFLFWFEGRFDVGTDDETGDITKSFEDATGVVGYDSAVFAIGARFKW